MSFDAGAIVARLSLNTNQFDTNLNRSQNNVRTATNSMVRGFGGIEDAIKAATGAMIGLSAMAAAGFAIRDALTFERSMRNVNSITGLTEAGLKSLNAEVLKFAKDSTQSPDLLAQGLYDIASSGFQGADGLKVLDASARSATAGMSTTATAAKVITGALNAYHLEAGKVGDVSDVLFQTVNKGVINFEQLAQGLGNIMAPAAASNIGLGELGAAIATLTVNGTPAAESMTNLQNLINKILAPSADLEKALKKMGYASGFAFLQANGLAGSLKKLDKATGGDVAGIRKFFPDVQAFSGALGLMGKNSATFSSNLRDIADATKVAGAANKAYQEQMKSPLNQYEAAKNKVKANVIESLTNNLLPTLTPIITAFGVLFNAAMPVVNMLAILAGKAATFAASPLGQNVIAISAAFIGLKMAIAPIAGIFGTAIGYLQRLAVEYNTTANVLKKPIQMRASGTFETARRTALGGTAQVYDAAAANRIAQANLANSNTAMRATFATNQYSDAQIKQIFTQRQAAGEAVRAARGNLELAQSNLMAARAEEIRTTAQFNAVAAGRSRSGLSVAQAAALRDEAIANSQAAVATANKAETDMAGATMAARNANARAANTLAQQGGSVATAQATVATNTLAVAEAEAAAATAAAAGAAGAQAVGLRAVFAGALAAAGALGTMLATQLAMGAAIAGLAAVGYEMWKICEYTKQAADEQKRLNDLLPGDKANWARTYETSKNRSPAEQARIKKENLQYNTIITARIDPNDEKALSDSVSFMRNRIAKQQKRLLTAPVGSERYKQLQSNIQFDTEVQGNLEKGVEAIRSKRKQNPDTAGVGVMTGAEKKGKHQAIVIPPPAGGFNMDWINKKIAEAESRKTFVIKKTGATHGEEVQKLDKKLDALKAIKEIITRDTQKVVLSPVISGLETGKIGLEQMAGSVKKLNEQLADLKIEQAKLSPENRRWHELADAIGIAESKLNIYQGSMAKWAQQYAELSGMKYTRAMRGIEANFASADLAQMQRFGRMQQIADQIGGTYATKIQAQITLETNLSEIQRRRAESELDFERQIKDGKMAGASKTAIMAIEEQKKFTLEKITNEEQKVKLQFQIEMNKQSLDDAKQQLMDFTNLHPVKGSEYAAGYKQAIEANATQAAMGVNNSGDIYAMIRKSLSEPVGFSPASMSYAKGTPVAGQELAGGAFTRGLRNPISNIANYAAPGLGDAAGALNDTLKQLGNLLQTTFGGLPQAIAEWGENMRNLTAPQQVAAAAGGQGGKLNIVINIPESVEAKTTGGVPDNLNVVFQNMNRRGKLWGF